MADVTQIDDRYTLLRHLGKGFEGDATIYTDNLNNNTVVVKTFFGPSRNPMPSTYIDFFGRQTTQWPTEIPAMLSFSGFERKHGTGHNHGGLHVYKNGLVPVLDYFLLKNSSSPEVSSQQYTWSMVTPYIAGGTLSKLAPRLKQEIAWTPQDLDAKLRPTFLRLVSSLVKLHTRGYCHEDIKPDNLYALTPEHWLLGDLGNVRQLNHQYHFSSGWRQANQWSNCEHNDVRRALKSYMTLLRHGSVSSQEFDIEFYAERQSWSRLYWDFMRRPLYATEFIYLQESGKKPIINSGHGPAQVPGWTSSLPPEVVATAVERELTCTILKTTWKEWWALGGFWQRIPLEKSLVSRRSIER
ncbi:uncharacterized protein K452DRAFT_234733 [Aplosporella prunicola CBS 121167]|uniref:Protein kinase domain-containing protein n=1 Tax=Aplosporella prunicola CBS 121167 TaxID=1176127 RepID=A0A6A6B2Q1_9PEZI|nr:uncharacterized protein K452DRAFT_234733 [Aplosporella prunicola CBS 121167]KAF2138096.1 hypothetical protein K452DRAFT_234733 [Aplosporella prunicola CBS 121167]